MVEGEDVRAGHKPGSVSRIGYPLRDNVVLLRVGFAKPPMSPPER